MGRGLFVSRARSRSDPDEIELRVSRSSGPGGPAREQGGVARRGGVRRRGARAPLSRGPEATLAFTVRPVLRAVAQDERSQARNRELAVERLVEKLAEALRVERRRLPTRPTGAAKERRLAGEKHPSQTKKLRRPPLD